MTHIYYMTQNLCANRKTYSLFRENEAFSGSS